MSQQPASTVDDGTVVVTVPPAGDDTPPGWDENPSAWKQRIPIIVLALFGVAVAGWLALYQQEVTDTVWEPFFPGGTKEIVRESGFSKSFGPAADEVMASLQYLRDVRGDGGSVWSAFWGS